MMEARATLILGTLLGLCIGLVCIIGGTILENIPQSNLTTRLSGKFLKFTIILEARVILALNLQNNKLGDSGSFSRTKRLSGKCCYWIDLNDI